MGHSLLGSVMVFSALGVCSELTTSVLWTVIGIFDLSCFSRCLSVLKVVKVGGTIDMKLGSFLILASSLMKVAKTENGGNDTE